MSNHWGSLSSKASKLTSVGKTRSQGSLCFAGVLRSSAMLPCMRSASRVGLVSGRVSIASANSHLLRRSAIVVSAAGARSLNSTSAQMVDQQLHSVEVSRSNGTAEQLKVAPSYPNKPKSVENLLNGLREILSSGSISESAAAYGINHWQLDEEGNAIHRHFELYDQKTVQKLLASVDHIAEEINHHPHYCVQGHLLTITCATHEPPGLSMKDVKLARRINQVYEDFKASQPKVVTAGVEQSEIDMLRTFAVTQNNLEIQKAKESCNCAS